MTEGDPVFGCGTWVAVGGYKSVCNLLDGHEGQCLPRRSDVMADAAWHERQAQETYDAVDAIDAAGGGWPRWTGA